MTMEARKATKASAPIAVTFRLSSRSGLGLTPRRPTALRVTNARGLDLPVVLLLPRGEVRVHLIDIVAVSEAAIVVGDVMIEREKGIEIETADATTIVTVIATGSEKMTGAGDGTTIVTVQIENENVLATRPEGGGTTELDGVLNFGRLGECIGDRISLIVLCTDASTSEPI